MGRVEMMRWGRSQSPSRWLCREGRETGVAGLCLAVWLGAWVDQAGFEGRV